MLYAAYGSNLHPRRLTERVPDARLLGTAQLEERALRFHKRGQDGSGKCNVIETPESNVHVAIYDLPAQQKPALDVAEGVGAGYRIETLEIDGYGECFLYVATASHIDEKLLPFSWYKELVLAGGEFLQFPREYVARIAETESAMDPDMARHTSNMLIVRDARGQPDN